MRRTKIICTLGPSTDKDGIMEALVQEGMNVARFNFSHGSHEEQRGRLRKLEELRSQYRKPIAALFWTRRDLKSGSDVLQMRALSCKRPAVHAHC